MHLELSTELLCLVMNLNDQRSRRPSLGSTITVVLIPQSNLRDVGVRCGDAPESIRTLASDLPAASSFGPLRSTTFPAVRAFFSRNVRLQGFHLLGRMISPVSVRVSDFKFVIYTEMMAGSPVSQEPGHRSLTRSSSHRVVLLPVAIFTSSTPAQRLIKVLDS